MVPISLEKHYVDWFQTIILKDIMFRSIISLGGAPGDIQCNKAPIPRKIWKLFTKREASDVYIAKNPLIGTLFRLNYPANCFKKMNSIIWVEIFLVLQVI